MGLSLPCAPQAWKQDRFYLSPTRNAKAAKRFLGKALNGLKAWEKPEVINTDRAPTYGIAISELKDECKCPEKTVHRQVKYLNNVIEADHGKLKQLILQCECSRR
jgi:IS6 family transposase